MKNSIISVNSVDLKYRNNNIPVTAAGLLVTTADGKCGQLNLKV